MDLFLAAPNKGGCPSVSDLTESEYGGGQTIGALFSGSYVLNRSYRTKQQQHLRQSYDDDFQHPIDYDHMNDDAMSRITERESSQPNETSQHDHDMLRERRMKFFQGEKEDLDQDDGDGSDHELPPPLDESSQPDNYHTNGNNISNDDNNDSNNNNNNNNNDECKVSINGENNGLLCTNDLLIEKSNNIALASLYSFDGEHKSVVSPPTIQNSYAGIAQDSLPCDFTPIGHHRLGFRGGWNKIGSNANSGLLQKANSVASMFNRTESRTTTRKSLAPMHVLSEVCEDDVALLLAALKLQLAEYQTSLDISEHRYHRVVDENTHLRAHNKYMEQQDRILDAELVQMRQAWEEGEIIISNLKEECEHLVIERDKKARDSSDFRVALEACVAEINKSRALLTSLQTSLDEEHAQKNKLQDTLEDKTEKIDTLRLQIDEAATVLRSMRDQAQTASVERAALLKKVTMSQHERDKLRSIAKDRNVEIESMKKELQRGRRSTTRSASARSHPSSRSRRPFSNVAGNTNAERSSSPAVDEIVEEEVLPPFNSRTLGPINLSWFEEILFPSKRKRPLNRSVSEMLQPSRNANTNKNTKTKDARRKSESHYKTRASMAESSEQRQQQDNTVFEEAVPPLSRDNDDRKIPASRAAADQVNNRGENYSPSRPPWSNPFVTRWLVHLPFFGGSKGDVTKEKADATEPSSDNNKKKTTSSAAVRKPGSRDNNADTSLERKKKKSSTLVVEKSDNSAPIGVVAENGLITIATEASKSSRYQDVHKRQNAAAQFLADASYDDSDDELTNIWASARHTINCESSDDDA